jgi:hypothetical protein
MCILTAAATPAPGKLATSTGQGSIGTLPVVRLKACKVPHATADDSS